MHYNAKNHHDRGYRKGVILKKQNVFISLRAPSHQVDKAHSRLRDLIISNPGVDTQIVGLADDGERVELTIVITVPRSNTHPVAIMSLRFIHSMNLGLFDYSPFYRGEPSIEEKEAFQQYSTRWMLSQLQHDDEIVRESAKVQELGLTEAAPLMRKAYI